MYERRKLKYGILAVLLLLIASQNIHFGDYCNGMVDGLTLLFLCTIFILFFIIIEIRDFRKLIYTNQKFDFVPLILFLSTILLNWFLVIADDNKYWKEIKYEGKVDDFDARARIILYENNHFEVSKSYIEERCIYTGKYHFENNILILEDENIETKTDHNFTKKYILVSDSILQPIDIEYHKIRLYRK